MRSVLLVSVLSLVAFAGCVDSTDLDSSASVPYLNLRELEEPLDLIAGDALWVNHQDEPHPAYNWPTLSSPAADAVSWHQPIEGVELANITTGLSLISPTSGVVQGAGIAIYGSLAVVPGFGPESHIVDIRDPAHPEVLSTFTPQEWVNPEDPEDVRPNSHRGATIIAYPDGRIVTAISTSRIIDVWDITDPTNPLPLPALYPTQGSHKVGLVPGTPILYNAASAGGSANGLAGSGHLPNGGERVTEIFDLTDPENPVHVQDWQNGYACHHIYFWNNAEENKARGLCAGIEVTQIWDTTDPLNPEVIVDVPVHHGIAGSPSASVPIVAFSHFAGMNTDGTILLVGDEEGGGGLAPGCVANVKVPGGLSVAGETVTRPGPDGAVSVPVGALWFYDISDETNPVLQGYYSATRDPRSMNAADAGLSCTAHHGRIIPAEGRDLIAMSFYGAGVHIVDFTNPSLAFAVDTHASGSNTWETWYYNGYLFTGDLNRGMEVFTVDGVEA